MTTEVCRICGAPFSEHRYCGELEMHPGFADTWDEHVRIAKTFPDDETALAALHKRRELLRNIGVIA